MKKRLLLNVGEALHLRKVGFEKGTLIKMVGEMGSS